MPHNKSKRKKGKNSSHGLHHETPSDSGPLNRKTKSAVHSDVLSKAVSENFVQSVSGSTNNELLGKKSEKCDVLDTHSSMCGQEEASENSFSISNIESFLLKTLLDENVNMVKYKTQLKERTKCCSCGSTNILIHDDIMDYSKVLLEFMEENKNLKHENKSLKSENINLTDQLNNLSLPLDAKSQVDAGQGNLNSVVYQESANLKSLNTMEMEIEGASAIAEIEPSSSRNQQMDNKIWDSSKKERNRRSNNRKHETKFLAFAWEGGNRSSLQEVENDVAPRGNTIGNTPWDEEACTGASGGQDCSDNNFNGAGEVSQHDIKGEASADVKHEGNPKELRKNYHHGGETNERPRKQFNSSNRRNQSDDRGGQAAGRSGSDRVQRTYKIVDETFGDLFMAPKDNSLAHCVAEDMRMGSGIAVTFRQMFKQVENLLEQGKRSGQVAVLEDEGRFIYYLVTKKVSNGKPRYSDLASSVEEMKQHCIKFGVTKIAMPRIGCGLDRLEWSKVKDMLEDKFSGTDVRITVYNFQQDSAEPEPPVLRSRLYVRQVLMSLVSIAASTGLVFLGTEDSHVDATIESLDTKYGFLYNYKTCYKRVGEVVKFEKKGEYLYGLIVKKNANDHFSYETLFKCLLKFRDMICKDKYYYFGMEAFIENDDDLTVEKVITLLKYVFFSKKLEAWICWPPNLEEVYKRFNYTSPLGSAVY